MKYKYPFSVFILFPFLFVSYSFSQHTIPELDGLERLSFVSISPYSTGNSTVDKKLPAPAALADSLGSREINFYQWNDDWSSVQIYPSSKQQFPFNVQLTQVSTQKLELRIYTTIGKLVHRQSFPAGDFFQIKKGDWLQGNGHYYVEIIARDLHYMSRLLVK